MGLRICLVLAAFIIAIGPPNAFAASRPSDAQASLAHHQHHPEYRDCITHWVDACGAWNADYVPPQAHGPTLADTLDWIGAQLSGRGVVHQFYHDGCNVAVDAKEGTPVQLMWQENSGGALETRTKLVFHPDIAGGPSAEGLMGNGYTTFFRQDYRQLGTANSPKRIIHYNDAALMDLGQLREIKNYVGTKDEGGLYLVNAPTSSIKFNFKKAALARTNYVGAGFSDAASALTEGPVALAPETTDHTAFGGIYELFESKESHPQYILLLPSHDIDFNIKITKAFLHAISLCEPVREGER